jgi:cephalosporin hydroxylase
MDLAQDVLSYWRMRAAQHTSDWYAGVPMSKFPEDLRVYEHLLWASRADVVVEIGTQFGGSALWFRDRLRAFEQYGRIRRGTVISIDLDLAAAREALSTVDPNHGESIMLVEGDVRDPTLPSRVRDLVPASSRCLVVEDSAHTYETTWAALVGFASLVPYNGYFVVEDGSVDVEEMRLSESWPRGVLPALEAWLATREGSEFTVRRDLERYGFSNHPYGFLQRTTASSRSQSLIPQSREEPAIVDGIPPTNGVALPTESAPPSGPERLVPDEPDLSLLKQAEHRAKAAEHRAKAAEQRAADFRSQLLRLGDDHFDERRYIAELQARLADVESVIVRLHEEQALPGSPAWQLFQRVRHHGYQMLGGRESPLGRFVERSIQILTRTALRKPV